MGIVNAKTVNAGCQNFFLPQFYEFFCDLGRILHFKNPVKYSGNLQINHRTVHFRAAGGDGAS